MRTVIVVLALVAYCQAARITYDDVLQTEWTNFKQQQNKSYSDETEDLVRSLIFKDNKRIIDEHNKRWQAGEVSYWMAVNQFTDLLPKEFENLMLSSPADETDAWNSKSFAYVPSTESVELPKTKDWRNDNAVTHVKDQGSCRACYAFSAVGALESHHYIKTGKLISLSEQNIVDCSRRSPYFNTGCLRGTLHGAFKYIKDKGIDSEASYPYKRIELKCAYSKNNVAATMRDSIVITRGDEKDMMHAVATKGPLSVEINASGWQHYSGGVFNDPGCSRKATHGVVIVGYGTFHDLDYWLLKNSWGGSWGEGGYLRVARNKHNQCGVANSAIYPLI